MKKVLIRLFLLFLLFFGVYASGLKIQAETNDVYLIMTNPSDDCSTEMNIVWHSKVTGSFVEYTTKDDTSFSNKKSAFPNEEELDIYDGTSGANIKDYKCEVTLKDLTPNTEYIYRVGLSEKSAVHNFKTAGSSEFSFAVLSDVHTYSKLSSRLSKANSIIHTMEGRKELSLVVAAGDIMAYGTNRGYWDDFTKSDFSNNYMIAATPGNHDYYNSSANFLDSSYFNAYTNNPDNGCDASKNTTYYFYYGNVLFISLNSEDACTNSSARQSQREWLETILSQNEEAMYKVVYFHRSMYPGSGSNTGHANTMKGAFQDIFDKYGIDLVFGGHDHVYVRTKKILNGVESTDTNYGTTYISLPQIGDRASSANDDMTGIAKKIGGISGAVLVTVTESNMSFSLIDDSGNVLDSGSVLNKMSTISKSKVNNGTKITFKDSFSNMMLTVPEILFQRAYCIKVIDKSNNKEVLNARPSYGKVDYRIIGVSDYVKQKDYTVEILYRNGTSFSKDITVKNSIDYGKFENIRIEGNTLLWDSNLDSEIVEEIRVIDNKETSTYSINDSSHNIKSPIFGETIIKIQLIAVDGALVDEFEVPYGINQSDVAFAVPEIVTTVNKKIDLEIVNSANIDIQFYYEYDEQFIENIDGSLYAKKEGSTTIICKNELFDDLIVSVTINAPEKYIVRYDYNGGEPLIEYEEVSSYDELLLFKMDTQPAKEGYNLVGWYLDKDLTMPVDLNVEITGDVTLYAKWAPIEKQNESKKTGCNAATVLNLLLSLSVAFGLTYIVKKKH